ncbi:MAG: energy-coupling factor ABC transporter ATP-binding protein, partial [Tissierellia bacterium]|nr:energy-coupling factor ABC transporter ATP-binding protein [Tissierellia bacterium]
DVFMQVEKLEDMGLGIPQITSFMRSYRLKGHDIKDDILTIEDAKAELIRYLRSREDA